MSVGMWNWLWHLYVHWSALFYRSAIALVFPYIFCYKLTILNWLSLMTLNSKESSLCSGICLGGILSFTWVKLTFPDIFLLVHCFEWAVIGVIELQRVCSPLCQFLIGGSIISFTWVNLNSKELLFPLSVSIWGSIVSLTQVNLKIWACFKFCSCFTELFHFLYKKWKTNKYTRFSQKMNVFPPMSLETP